MEESKVQEVEYSVPGMCVYNEQDVKVVDKSAVGYYKQYKTIATFYGNGCRKNALEYVEFLRNKNES